MCACAHVSKDVFPYVWTCVFMHRGQRLTPAVLVCHVPAYFLRPSVSELTALRLADQWAPASAWSCPLFWGDRHAPLCLLFTWVVGPEPRFPNCELLFAMAGNKPGWLGRAASPLDHWSALRSQNLWLSIYLSNRFCTGKNRPFSCLSLGCWRQSNRSSFFLMLVFTSAWS